MVALSTSIIVDTGLTSGLCTDTLINVRITRFQHCHDCHGNLVGVVIWIGSLSTDWLLLGMSSRERVRVRAHSTGKCHRPVFPPFSTPGSKLRGLNPGTAGEAPCACIGCRQ